MSPETAVISGSVWIRTRARRKLTSVLPVPQGTRGGSQSKAFLVFRGDVSTTLEGLSNKFSILRMVALAVWVQKIAESGAPLLPRSACLLPQAAAESSLPLLRSRYGCVRPFAALVGRASHVNRLSVPSNQLIVEECDYPPAELLRRRPQRSGVQRSRDPPQFLCSSCRAQNHFRMPAGQHHIRSVTDQQQRKLSAGHRLFRGYFAGRKSRQMFAAIDQRPRSRCEKCLSQRRRALQAGIVICSFL